MRKEVVEREGWVAGGCPVESDGVSRGGRLEDEEDGDGLGIEVDGIDEFGEEVEEEVEEELMAAGVGSSELLEEDEMLLREETLVVDGCARVKVGVIGVVYPV